MSKFPELSTERSVGLGASLNALESVLTAAEYLKLAEQCFALASATLNPDARRVFLEAGRDYLEKAKAIDPTIQELSSRKEPD